MACYSDSMSKKEEPIGLGMNPLEVKRKAELDESKTVLERMLPGARVLISSINKLIEESKDCNDTDIKSLQNLSIKLEDQRNKLEKLKIEFQSKKDSYLKQTKPGLAEEGFAVYKEVYLSFLDWLKTKIGELETERSVVDFKIKRLSLKK